MEKDKNVLVFYVYLGGVSTEKANSILNEREKYYDTKFKGTDIIFVVIPITEIDNKTNVELIKIN